MKILLIDDGKEWRGGQRQTYLLARGLIKRGFDVILACQAGGELVRLAKQEKIQVYETPMRGEWDAMAAWRLGNLSNEVDIVHTQTAHAHTLALLAVRIGAWKPVVVHRRVDFQPSGGPFAKWKYRSPDRFIAISEAVAQSLRMAGVPDKKIRIVYSGIDPKPVQEAPRKDLREELNLSPQTPLIGNVAQLVDHKGHRYLLEAMPAILRQVPDAHLAIAGSGELEGELKNLAKQLAVDHRVHFLGYRKDVPSIIKSFDVFVMPSHLEGLGTSVLDAFAAQVPVAAASAGGMPEIITDGIDGKLFESKNPTAIANTVSAILLNPERGKKYAQSASKKLLSKFTDDAMVEGVISVYKEISA